MLGKMSMVFYPVMCAPGHYKWVGKYSPWCMHCWEGETKVFMRIPLHMDSATMVERD